MSAGLPGLGLGGLFFIVSALLGPVVELHRTARGQSSREAWRGVGRQFAIALMMIVAVDLALRLAFVGVEATGIGEGPADRGVTVLPLVPIAITLALLATLLATAKAAHLALHIPRGLAAIRPVVRRPIRSPGRFAAATALALSAWFALLLLGASELSPLAGDGANSPESETEERLVEEPRSRDGGRDSRPAGLGGEGASGAPATAPDGGSAPTPGSELDEAEDTSASDPDREPEPDEDAAGPDSPQQEAQDPEATAPAPSGPPGTADPPGGGRPEGAGSPPQAATPPDRGPPDDTGRPAER